MPHTEYNRDRFQDRYTCSSHWDNPRNLKVFQQLNQRLFTGHGHSDFKKCFFFDKSILEKYLQDSIQSKDRIFHIQHEFVGTK